MVRDRLSPYVVLSLPPHIVVRTRGFKWHPTTQHETEGLELTGMAPEDLAALRGAVRSLEHRVLLRASPIWWVPRRAHWQRAPRLRYARYYDRHLQGS
jgi:hypothetical protein